MLHASNQQFAPALTPAEMIPRRQCLPQSLVNPVQSPDRQHVGGVSARPRRSRPARSERIFAGSSGIAPEQAQRARAGSADRRHELGRTSLMYPAASPLAVGRKQTLGLRFPVRPKMKSSEQSVPEFHTESAAAQGDDVTRRRFHFGSGHPFTVQVTPMPMALSDIRMLPSRHGTCKFSLPVG